MIEVVTNLKLIFFIVFFIVFIILENYFSQRNTKGKIKRLLFHGTIAIINTTIMRVFAIFLLIPVVMITKENQYGLLNSVEYNFFFEALIGFLLLDFAFYWFHRISHTWSFLWRFHGMHHLDTQMDITTSLRFHIGELIISAVFKAMLIIALGLPMSIFIFYEIILTASAQFHHSDLRLPDALDSKISKIIVTPKYHTNHHTVTNLSRNANYSSIFTLWDYVFFTYKNASVTEREHLGIEDRSKEFGLIANIKYPFRKL
tara:strand:- start:5 stop:781 length:777 start_codon:yes stop_codon:yes gene_type:complete